MKTQNARLKIIITFGLLIIALPFIFCLLTFPRVFAQEQSRQSALGVSPAIIEIVLDPGKKKETKVSVFNVTNFPLPIKGSVKSFVPKEEIAEEAEEIFDASAWIKINPADFILQPREKKEVKITIIPPQEAEPGGHYATVYFQPLVPVEVLSPQTAYLTARVGVLVFLIVKGEIVEKAWLGDLQTVKFRQFGPIEFTALFRNEGNIHLLPSGEIKIFDFRGREVETLKISPVTILPKATKELVVKWPKKYLFGKFTTQAKILYGSEHKKLESDPIEFWVVPWIPILFSIGALTFFTIFLILVRGRLILAFKVLIGKAEVWELKKIKLK